MNHKDSGLVNGTNGSAQLTIENSEAKSKSAELEEAALISELKSSGVKISEKDVIFATKDRTGQIVWLENGNDSVGLKHIIREHGSQFNGKGISNTEIPNYILEAIRKGNIVGYQGKKNPRDIYEFTYRGRKQRVAVQISSNGFIVGANPKSV